MQDDERHAPGEHGDDRYEPAPRRVLAARVPDPSLHDQTGLYIWLLPVISVMYLVVGPLIASVLYALMILKLRTDIGDVIAAQTDDPAQPEASL